MFYVYVHYQADDPNGLPIYIGKGKNKRMVSPRRNPLWKNLVAKHGFIAKKVKEHLSEQEAWDIETELIKQYGKRIDGSGCLCNIADGGEGAAGVIHSIETKRKWSLAKKGKSYEEIYGIDKADIMREKRRIARTGRIHSEQTKKLLSDLKKGSKNSMFGKKITAEHSKKLSAAKVGKPSNTKGKKFSEIARQHMAKAAKIRAKDLTIAEKISKRLLGIKRSEETKQKMRIAAKERERKKKLLKG